jgi:hypothetical protein
MKNAYTKYASLFIIFTLFYNIGNTTNYYLNTQVGSNANNGTTINTPFKTITALEDITFKAGDSILFATGQLYSGMLTLKNVQGNKNNFIYIGSYTFNNNYNRPIIDAGENLNSILLQNTSFIKIAQLELTATIPYINTTNNKDLMRCGILVLTTENKVYEGIIIEHVLVHDVFFHQPGFIRSAEETKTANGTQIYGWGVRFINNATTGKLINIHVNHTEIYNVSHTGLKFTAPKNGIENVIVNNCKIHDTGGPGMQLSGVNNAHIHHNHVNASGSIKDTRNWGRGSGLWTWSCSNIIIENNTFENANGPGDSAGVHIDYNCNDVVVQYNLSKNNAGGFCEILGNNYNCAYRYNISVNDGYRTKGVRGAFQEGKIFWLSGYVGNNKPNVGPYNSYFYNNTIYVADTIVPKIAISTSAKGILIANNIFYFEGKAKLVSGDQKKTEKEEGELSQMLMQNNLFLHKGCWPKELVIQDANPFFGNAAFKNKNGTKPEDFVPTNKKLIKNKGIIIPFIPNDTIGLRVGLKVKQDMLGKPIKRLPDIGAIEL